MIVIHPAAQQELIEAAAYYEEQLTGLGTEYLDTLEQVIDKIAANPHSSYLSHPHLQIRRYIVPRFPYLVYYRAQDERIDVFAIAHQSRKPDYWLERPDV